MNIDGATLVAIITVLGSVAVGGITGLFSWVVRRQSRNIDAATSRKTEAEAVAQEVKTARELLSDMRTYFSERLTAQAVEHKEEIEHVAEQLQDLRVQMRHIRQQQRLLQQSYARHRDWDQAAWSRLLQVDPSYPPPPTIEGLT
jgi:signal transduction protein with GAF and PtsI domain